MSAINAFLEMGAFIMRTSFSTYMGYAKMFMS